MWQTKRFVFSALSLTCSFNLAYPNRLIPRLGSKLTELFSETSKVKDIGTITLYYGEGTSGL